MRLGLRGMIGKGPRGKEVIEAIKELEVEDFPVIVANDVLGTTSMRSK